ncbi:MAG: type II toxin-antitoxin system VapC family toxin [Elusimicrobiota bacterium]
MLLVLDSNEYIFSLGISKKPSSKMLVDTILETFPTHSIRIPRLIVEEVRRHLTPEEFREFIGFVTTLTAIDEDFVVPFELGAKYESFGLKPTDAFIAAYVEWTGADALVTENRHFLNRYSNLPFKVLNAEDCLKLIKSSI